MSKRLKKPSKDGKLNKQRWYWRVFEKISPPFYKIYDSVQNSVMNRMPRRFDMNRKPNKPKWYLKLTEFVASPFYMIFCNGHMKADKAVRKLKKPYMILATHQSFMDFPMIVKGIRPKSTGWVISFDEFRRGNWLMYGIGGIPKRRFTHGIVTVKHTFNYLKELKHTITIFPEAGFCFAGINERIDGALGKFCKHVRVPIVMAMMNGNYLNSPQWRKHPYQRIRQEGHMYVLLTAEEIDALSAEEIQDRIEKAFVKDEYKWQVEKNYHIRNDRRAEGLHRILYKCPNCGKEFAMETEGIHLWCADCGAKWEMDTLSRLHGVNTETGFSHIPDWYRWERAEVRKEVENKTYHFDGDVRVEDFYSSTVGFVDAGKAHVVHDENGFTVAGEVYGSPIKLNRPVASHYSIHVEYDMFGRGDAFEIVTEQTSYFMFLNNTKGYITKIHFATEELYDYYIRHLRDGNGNQNTKQTEN